MDTGPDDADSLRRSMAALRDTVRKELARSHDPADPAVASARHKLRSVCVRLLLLDYSAAAEAEVEHVLWKVGFYQHIEAYRKRLRARSPAAASAAQSRLSRSFRSFLDTATGFYLQLLFRLRQRYGLRYNGLVELRHLTLFAPDTFPGPSLVPQEMRAYESCHRCLLFLGDIARYGELHNGSQEAKPFDVARKYYHQALLLLPDNGGPHNQLAVLATYVDNLFAAAYHYTRSLLVEKPFATARDNLAKLFQKIDAAFNGRDNSSVGDEELPLFLVHFHGLLFTREAGLSDDQCGQWRLAMQRACSDESVTLRGRVLHIVTLMIFTLDQSLGKPRGRPRATALRAGLDMLSCLAKRQRVDVEVLPAVKVMCDWLRGALPRLWDELVARHRDHQVWQRLVDLLNTQTGATQPFPADNFVQAMPLPEDEEMRGFLPLARAEHLACLAFRRLGSGAAEPDETESSERLCRANCMVAFGVWFAAFSAEQGCPLLFTGLDDTARHQFGLNELAPPAAVGATGAEPAVGMDRTWPGMPPAPFPPDELPVAAHAPQWPEGPLPVQRAVMAEDELVEEEIIVFKGAQAPVFGSAPHTTATLPASLDVDWTAPRPTSANAIGAERNPGSAEQLVPQSSPWGPFGGMQPFQLGLGAPSIGGEAEGTGHGFLGASSGSSAFLPHAHAPPAHDQALQASGHFAPLMSPDMPGLQTGGGSGSLGLGLFQQHPGGPPPVMAQAFAPHSEVWGVGQSWPGDAAGGMDVHTGTQGDGTRTDQQQQHPTAFGP